MSFLPHKPITGQSNPFQSQVDEPQEYSPQERRLLLRLAHDAVESLVMGRKPAVETTSSHLQEPRGVFTTIYRHGELRGCVGYVAPVSPLYQAVIETARAAASQDTRFAPVTSEEVRDLQISLSVLSPLRPTEAEEVEIGKHGLVVSMGGRRGLLLPQVPVEHGWDRVTFLEQTCRKAGLFADAWKAGATLEGFTAEVFADPVNVE
ncbi:MAG TPA: AmmeMemoRadiSam system protein A [Terriglobales bacterium]|nr:AmmeMemoRadiSam system protein A [Terriglobales bacterium]